MRTITSRATALLAFASVLLLAACASAPVNPNGLACSSDVLCMMRDWRGVWGGSVSESPVGPMSYTLYIEEKDKTVRMRMAGEEDGIDDIRNEFALVHFRRGTPRIRAMLDLRGKKIVRDYVYQPERSSDSSASFCLDKRGCVFGELIFTRLGKTAMGLRVMSEESRYAELKVRFLEKDVPQKSVKKERSRLTSEADERVRDGSIEVTIQGTPAPGRRAAASGAGAGRRSGGDDDDDDDEDEDGDVDDDDDDDE